MCFHLFCPHRLLSSITRATFTRKGLKWQRVSCSPRHISCLALRLTELPASRLSAPAAAGELLLTSVTSAPECLPYFATGGFAATSWLPTVSMRARPKKTTAASYFLDVLKSTGVATAGGSKKNHNLPDNKPP